jgi:hypothetical protein
MTAPTPALAVNLNATVRARLTPAGMAHLGRDPMRPGADVYEKYLWHFLGDFAAHMLPGAPMMFVDNEIIILMPAVGSLVRPVVIEALPELVAATRAMIRAIDGMHASGELRALKEIRQILARLDGPEPPAP